MGIRIEHQPSPRAAGLAAYQSGVGAARQRQQKYALDLMAQDKATRAQRQQQFGDRITKGMGAAVAGLPQIPDYADSETANRLGKLRQSANILASGAHGTGPQVQSTLQGILEEINDTVGGIQKPDAAQQAQDQTLYFDDNDGQWHKEAAPGRRPFFGGREMPPNPQQQQAAAEQQAEQKRVADEQKAAAAQAEADRKTAIGYAQQAQSEYEGPDPVPDWEHFLGLGQKKLEAEKKFFNPPEPSPPIRVGPTGSIAPAPAPADGPAAAPSESQAPPTGATSPPTDAAAPEIPTLQRDDSGRMSMPPGQRSTEDSLNVSDHRRANPMFNMNEEAGPEELKALLQSGGVGMLRRLRELSEIPKVRELMKKRWGVDVETIDEIYPDAPQAERPPVRSIAQEHVTAQTAPKMGQPDPTRVAEAHERVSRIPNQAVADRTRGTAAGAALDRSVGMSPRQRTMGGVSTQPHVPLDRQRAIEATRGRGLEEQQQRDTERAERNQSLEERAVAAKKRSEEALKPRDKDKVNEATFERGRQAAQQHAAARSPEEVEAQEALQQRAAAVKLEQSRRPRIKPKYYTDLKPTSATAPSRAERDAAIKQQRQARGIAKGNARNARLGKAPGVVRVFGDADFKSLPIGARYIGPDGQLRTKRTQ